MIPPFPRDGNRSHRAEPISPARRDTWGFFLGVLGGFWGGSGDVGFVGGGLRLKGLDTKVFFSFLFLNLEFQNRDPTRDLFSG